MLEFSVYILIHPMTDVPFYVGFTSRGIARLKEHYSESRRSPNSGNMIKNDIIRSIWQNGSHPNVEIALVTTSETEALNKERELIQKYGRLDLETGSLSNKTSGGQGNPGRVVSDVTRQILSNLRKDKSYIDLFGEEQAKLLKEQLKIANSGSGNPMYSRSHTLESKAQISKNRKGIGRIFYSEENREAIRKSNRTRQDSTTTRLKKSIAAKKNLTRFNPRTTTTRELISNNLKKSLAEKAKLQPKYQWLHEIHGSFYGSRNELQERYSNLNVGELGQVIRGNYQHHKGWKLVK